MELHELLELLGRGTAALLFALERDDLGEPLQLRLLVDADAAGHALLALQVGYPLQLRHLGLLATAYAAVGHEPLRGFLLAQVGKPLQDGQVALLIVCELGAALHPLLELRQPADVRALLELVQLHLLDLRERLTNLPLALERREIVEIRMLLAAHR